MLAKNFNYLLKPIMLLAVLYSFTGLVSGQSDTSMVHALRFDLVHGGLNYERKISKRFSASATVKAGLNYYANNLGPTLKYGVAIHPQMRLGLRCYILPLKNKKELSGLYAIGFLNYGTHRFYSLDNNYLHNSGTYPISPLIHLGAGYRFFLWKHWYINSSFSYGQSAFGRDLPPRPLFSITLNFGLNLPLK